MQGADQVVEALELPHPLLRVGPVHVLGLVQVLARAEGLAGADQDDGADVRILRHAPERIGKLALEGPAERVQDARAIEGDHGDAGLPLEEDARVHRA